MITYISAYLLSCWEVLIDSAPFMLVGFSIAGIFHIIIRAQIVTTYFSKGRISSVIYAALVGIVLPLCSCGGLPVAVGLKKRELMMEQHLPF